MHILSNILIFSFHPQFSSSEGATSANLKKIKLSILFELNFQIELCPHLEVHISLETAAASNSGKIDFNLVVVIFLD